jgi:hypothetical protein
MSAPTISGASRSLPGSCAITPEQNPVLRDLLPTITTPTQVVAGRDHEHCSGAMAKRWHSRLS